MSAVQPTHRLVDLLDDVAGRATGERITIGEIIAALGARAYGPALFLIALISMLPPISVTPGLPAFTSTIILLLSGQLLFSRPHPWLPQWLRHYSFASQHFVKAVHRARPWTRWLGRWVGPRLMFVLQPPLLNGIAFVCLLLALLALALSPLPGGENVPAAAVLIFGLALTADDGLLALVGLMVTASAVGLLVIFWDRISAACIHFAQAFAHAFRLQETPAILFDVLLAVAALLVVGTVIRTVGLLLARPPAERVASALGSLATWWMLFFLLACAVLLGAAVAVVAFALLSLLGLREYRRLSRQRVAAGRLWWLAFLAVPVHFAIAYHGWLTPFWTFVPIGAFVLLLMALLLAQETGRFLETAGILFLGLMLIVFLFSHAVLVFALPAHINATAGNAGLFLYLILLTELNDIAQALWGRTFGRHKMTRVSPNKTWEGFILGAATTIAAGLALAPLLTPFAEGPLRVGEYVLDMPYFPAFTVSLLIAIGGLFGDLTVSAVKREVGVKDSGDLLPGQGGILDRVDSLIFTAPLFFYFTIVFYS